MSDTFDCARERLLFDVVELQGRETNYYINFIKIKGFFELQMHLKKKKLVVKIYFEKISSNMKEIHTNIFFHLHVIFLVCDFPLSFRFSFLSFLSFMKAIYSANAIFVSRCE
jgi:hypothetical protein